MTKFFTVLALGLLTLNVYAPSVFAGDERTHTKKEVVKEFASKKSGGTAPSKKIISEENQVADRFRKLAGLIKS